MQGIHQFIPTEKKVSYLNALLKVGFHTLDCGSFVSPEAIPQLRDTDLVLDRLDLSDTRSKLLTIVANQRGGERAAQFEQISCLGYPFSVSEIFQKRNTNKSIAESLKVVDQLLNIAERSGKELVVYISMGFGNPYREPWSVNLVEKYVGKLIDKGVKTLSLSDTIGTSNPDSITYLFENLIQAFPQATIGAHLHTTSDTWYEKVSSAYDAGCRRFDGAIKGFGGCPMATDELTGNMPTEKLISFVEQRKIPHQLNMLAFESAYNKAMQTFPA
jgi:hydroxymethylglutaryl-CoA lyase